MEEKYQTNQTQHITGNFAANVQGEGNATVNVTMPPLSKQWLKSARQTMSKPFVGRQEVVDALIADLTTGKHVSITGKQSARALQGMGGIGKTYLAIKLAIELYDHFPGGVIRLDIGPQVSDEASTLVPLSRLASYAFGGIPPLGQFQPEQVAAWLNETAPGPFLVIFDDVWYPTPLRLLSRALPPGTVQLVTTRFANIAQVIGATVVPLDRLRTEDGLALLEERLHSEGNTTYRPMLEALVNLLGGHALALEIAAAQIKKLSRLPSVYHELLQGIGQGKIDHLKLFLAEDREVNLDRSFALSYERMSSEQQQRFRTLGVFAEESIITSEAAAAVWGIDTINRAQTVLFEMADLALLTEIEEPITGITSFRQHGLLRLYARALLETANELAQASQAHAQYYTNLSWQVSTTLPEFRTLLDQHTPNLLIALAWTNQHNPSLFSSLVKVLSNYLLIRGQLGLLEKYLPQAVSAAHAIADRVREANLLKSLGDLQSRLSNLDQARTHYEAALILFHTEQDYLSEAQTLQSLGDLERRLGNVERARAHYDAALPLFRLQYGHLGEANVLKGTSNFDQAHVQNEEAVLSLYEARVSFIDGAGAQMVMLSWKREDGLLKGVNVLLQDNWGIKDCYGTDEMEVERWEELVSSMEEQGFNSFKVPLDYCRAVIAEAHAVNKRTRHKISVAYAVWRPLIEGVETPRKSMPPIVTIVEPRPYTAEMTLLAQCGQDLYKLPEFNSWFYDPFDQVKPFIGTYTSHLRGRANPRARKRKELRKTVTDQAKLEAVVSEALEKVVNDAWRLLYESRLRRQAALFQLINPVGEARLMSAVASMLHPASGVSPQDQPFLRGMMHYTLENSLLRLMTDTLKE